jgi:hypothetical protein
MKHYVVSGWWKDSDRVALIVDGDQWYIGDYFCSNVNMSDEEVVRRTEDKGGYAPIIVDGKHVIVDDDNCRDTPCPQWSRDIFLAIKAKHEIDVAIENALKEEAC